MKTYDIIGFSAIGIAGYIAGRDMASGPGTFSAMDIFLIAALIGLGFFFAVILS